MLLKARGMLQESIPLEANWYALFLAVVKDEDIDNALWTMRVTDAPPPIDVEAEAQRLVLQNNTGFRDVANAVHISQRKAEMLRAKIRKEYYETRNNEIIARRRAGESCANLAKAFALTPTGLNNLLVRHAPDLIRKHGKKMGRRPRK